MRAKSEEGGERKRLYEEDQSITLSLDVLVQLPV